MFLKTFVRTFKKNRFFSFLNVFGLALGMSVFLLIALYIKFESSYEDFNPSVSSTYRIALEVYRNEERLQASAENYPALAHALADLPEVEDVARAYNLGYKNNVIITNEYGSHGPVAFKQKRFLYADSSFLSVMGYSLSTGDIATALAAPNQAVITREYAKLYFGDENPIGKELHMHDDDSNDELVHVTGVVDETPDNTHLKFDILFSYKTLFARQGDPRYYAYGGIPRFDLSWTRNDMYTYVRLRPGTDVNDFTKRLNSLEKKYNPNIVQSEQRNVFTVQPLHDIHLTSQLADEAELNSDGRILYFIGLIGLFVLGISLINYVNLATAQAMERAREVGVRKIMGALKVQLVKQFLTEAALINLGGIILSLALVSAVLPVFNSISGLPLDVNYLLQPWFVVLLFILWMGGTILAGFYPAMILSSFSPLLIVKGRMKNSSRGVLLRKSLVVVQFVASVSLIAGTLIVYSQLNHMLNQNIGVNIDQVLVVERPGIGPRLPGFNASVEAFRNELKSSAAVESFSMSFTIPGKQRQYKIDVKRYGTSDDQFISVLTNSMDYEFADVYKMNLLAGRVFSQEHVQDVDTSVVITASLVKQLGFKDPEDAIGQTLSIPDWYDPIIVGVVNDYHQVSLKNPLQPTVFYCDTENGEYYSLRIHSKNITETIAQIEKAYIKAFPGNPFEYFFLDDYFNAQYKNERQFGILFTTFAALALAIGCLGLLGLAAYTTMQRTKEIGIRKVLGSSEIGIFVHLSKEYIRLILLATVLAVPLVYFVMNEWIESFSYHVSIQAEVFIIAGCFVLTMAMLTVSFQTIKAARANPVKSLRSE
ncbi:MAG TPA: ABC transporter permease [Ohtaekwangia sp.]|uniref:ABC transporter permease n=1 Tax=Ohtaekwangia sp. TaxID=2066019 RepID=UPI002F931080